MHISLTTGHDSFRATGASPRRNCMVSTYVRVENDGEGKKTTPVFAAYKQRLKGFRKTSLVSVIPASDKFGTTDAGQWFVNRHEVLPGTEILIEFKERKPTGFSENVEHLLIVADSNAPLWQIRVELTPHELSTVPYLFFEGRFHIVSEDAQLPDKAVPIWRKHLGLDEEYHVSDVLDPNQEDHKFVCVELEAAIKQKVKSETVTDTKGKTRRRIRRVRNIKT